MSIIAEQKDEFVNIVSFDGDSRLTEPEHALFVAQELLVAAEQARDQGKQRFKVSRRMVFGADFANPDGYAGFLTPAEAIQAAFSVEGSANLALLNA